jgi:hypothetical protein
MKFLKTTGILFVALGCFSTLNAQTIVKSPDKAIDVKVELTANGELNYSVNYKQQQLLQPSKLGLILTNNNFSEGLKLVSVSKPKKVKESYELYAGKRRMNSYEANEQTVKITNANGASMDVIFRVSNHGVAFRYLLTGNSKEQQYITEEKTAYRFANGSKGFLQPMSVAKTGWCETNPSYEEHYVMDVKPGTQSPLGAGWIYPALFNNDKVWMLISETAIERNYCGTRLVPGKNDNEFQVGFPDARETFTNSFVNPQSVLPWATPWRLMAIGSLADVAESTLGTDLADAAPAKDYSWVKPGIASWSWIIKKDESVNYNDSKEYIDFAAKMHWSYCLIDADWDRRIGYEKIEELSKYAQSKNVGLILWYNSSGDWNSTVYSPKSALLTHEAREKEFARIEKLGIKGVKVDFFGGDGQPMMAYYLDILDDAYNHHLTVNFHGATLPRGWERTYPHLVTTEAIKGMEFITFDQQIADKQPWHCAMLPFTRNVFDPMDFTPMNLTSLPGIQRRTTSAFELALPTLFISGIQHLAETPDMLNKVPDYVISYLQNIPSRWDDSKLIDGYPGKLAIMARKAGNTWYIAGINGEGVAKKVTIDLSFIKKALSSQMITDGKEPGTFTQQTIDLKKNKTTQVELLPNGGFVMVVK